MREIKFRGRTISGRWFAWNMFGEILNEKIVLGKEVFLTIDGMVFDEETIGQYTGLKDKNGAEIYEGDIISAGAEYTYEIKYYGDEGAFGMYTNDGNEDWLMADMTITHFAVIGNIHENPELLSVGMTNE